MHNCTIAVYGLGPASIFFLRNFFDTDIKINVYELGKEKDFSKIETINKVNGPIEFFKNSNPERAKGFFGTASLWEKKGVGGKFFKFDKEDFQKWDWPINFDEINKNYDQIIEYLDTSLSINIKRDFQDLDIKSFINFSKKENIYQKKGSQTLSYCFADVIRKLKSKIKNSKNINIIYQSELLNFEISKNKNLIEHANIIKNGKIIKVIADYHNLSLGCLESNKIILKTFKDYPSFIRKNKIGRKLTFHQSINIGSFKSFSRINKSFIKKKINFTNEILGLKFKNLNKKNPNSFVVLAFEPSQAKSLIKRIYNKLFGTINKINVSLAVEHLPSSSCFIELSDKKKNMFNIFTSYNSTNLNFAKKEYSKYIKFLNQTEVFGYKFFKKDFHINFETNNHHHGGLIFGNRLSNPVDKNLQFKSLKNLYINSSSIFPNSSVYNPTFTIIAFANRLSNFIYKKIKS
tara:strand:- start:185 stop:1567 length:1383 start_codon:yes stop_codon:yes gene_type:complete